MTKDPDFFDRMKAVLTVVLPLFAAQTCYYRATAANDDAAHDEKIRTLMFSSLPTKVEVQAHWTQQDAELNDVRKRIERLEAEHFVPCK